MIIIKLLLCYFIVEIYGFQQNRTSIFGSNIYSSIQINPFDISWIDLDAASCSIPGSTAKCNTLNQTFSDLIEAKSFNFSIPESNITITSIFVTWYVSVESEIIPRIHEVQMSIFKDGGGLTGIKYNTPIISYSSSQGWSTSVESITYPKPGETDLLWGIQWNSSEINSQNFGVSLRLENPSGSNINCHIYCIEISVEYENVNINITQTTTSESESSSDLITTSEEEDSDVVIQIRNEYNILGISIIIIFAILLLFISCLIYKRRKNKKYQINEEYGLHRTSSILDDQSIYITEPISFERHLGSGKFGDVNLCSLGKVKVACKELKNDHNDKELENEIRILMNLRHPYIVACYGIYKYNEIGREHKFIVMEYLPESSLDKFLKRSDIRNKLNISDLISLCTTTVIGMKYLEDRNIIHRDLAGRNLLVFEQDQKYIIKITDFGMGKQIEQDIIDYKEENSLTIAIKWSAPEVILQRIYSNKSDVWSFGIVLWEIFSWGESPYNNLSNKDTITWVMKGHRLAKPENCPEPIYNIMKNSCWNHNPQNRFSFKSLYNLLRKIEKMYDNNNHNNNNVDKELVCDSSYIDSHEYGDDDEDEYGEEYLNTKSTQIILKEINEDEYGECFSKSNSNKQD